MKSKPYRNFKAIYGNITLKKNVVLLTATDYVNATVQASKVLEKMGYAHLDTKYAPGSRTNIYAPAQYGYSYQHAHPDCHVTLTLVDLHYNRKF